jgi:hypothetical protein
MTDDVINESTVQQLAFADGVGMLKPLSVDQRTLAIDSGIGLLGSLGYDPSLLADIREIGVKMFDVCDQEGFIVSLDDVYKWLGYTRKGTAKTALTGTAAKKSIFKKGKDYTILRRNGTATEESEKALQESLKRFNGGQNKETILMTAVCFQLFCLQAGTSRSALVGLFYINLLMETKRFSEAVSRGDISLVDHRVPAAAAVIENSPSQVRVGLCYVHHCLKKALGSSTLTKVYAIVNERISGIKKSALIEKLGLSDNSRAIFRDYLPSSAIRLMDYVLDAVNTRVSSVGKKDILSFTEEICGTVSGSAETYLHPVIKLNLGKKYLSLANARDDIKNSIICNGDVPMIGNGGVSYDAIELI